MWRMRLPRSWVGQASPILTREQPDALRTKIGLAGMDGLGRWLEVDVDTAVGPLTVVSAYVHTGEADTPKQVDKYAFLDGHGHPADPSAHGGAGVAAQTSWSAGTSTWRTTRSTSRTGRATAGGPASSRRSGPTSTAGSTGSGSTSADGTAGPGPGPYTWWSWRGRSFDTDGGWRIDYAVATPGLADRCTSVVVGKAADVRRAVERPRAGAGDLRLTRQRSRDDEAPSGGGGFTSCGLQGDGRTARGRSVNRVSEVAGEDRVDLRRALRTSGPVRADGPIPGGSADDEPTSGSRGLWSNMDANTFANGFTEDHSCSGCVCCRLPGVSRLT